MPPPNTKPHFTFVRLLRAFQQLKNKYVKINSLHFAII